MPSSRFYDNITARSVSAAAGPKLLLPTTSMWDNVWDAVQGAWSAVTDEKSRDAFETLIKDGVIRDQVLQNAINGSSMTFGLFHQLSNPLWEKHGFKAKEFVHAVGPALTNLHDVLHSLQNKFSKTAFKQELERQAAEAAKLKIDDSTTATQASKGISVEDIVSALDAEYLTEYLQSGNLWRTRAHAFEAATKANEQLCEKEKIVNNCKNDTIQTTATETPIDQKIDDSPLPSADELAASLVKMTTPGFLDAAYLSWKLSMMALIASARINSSTRSDGGGENIQFQNLRPTYEEGSFQIRQVAILHARVMSMSTLPTEDDEDGIENLDDMSKATSTNEDTTLKANGDKGNNSTSKTRSNQGVDSGDYKMDDPSSSSDDDSYGVAAQIDVLYEATSTFMELSADVATSSADPDEVASTSTMDTDDTSASSSSDKTSVREEEMTATANATEAKDDRSKASDNATKNDKPPVATMDRIKVDSVGVAVLEGWFHGGPGPERELRWRVAALRDPYEFPGAIPIHRTILQVGGGAGSTSSSGKN
jgi:hypothetical protein